MNDLLAEEAFQDILFALTMQVVFNEHASAVLSSRDCFTCSQSCRLPAVSATADDRISCPHCQTKVSSQRLANHLEKCLGIGRRAKNKAVDDGDSDRKKGVLRLTKCVCATLPATVKWTVLADWRLCAV